MSQTTETVPDTTQQPTTTPETTPATTTATPEETPKPSVSDALKETAAAEPKGQESEPVVPDKYDFKLPEGYVLNEKLVEQFTPIAKELKLTNDQANKLAQLHIAQQQEEEATRDREHKAWIDQLHADKDLGGANFDETKKHLKAGLSAFFDDTAISLLVETKFIDFPPLIKGFVKLGKALTEESLRGSGGSAGDGTLTEQELLRQKYPSMFNEDGSERR